MNFIRRSITATFTRRPGMKSIQCDFVCFRKRVQCDYDHYASFPHSNPFVALVTSQGEREMYVQLTQPTESLGLRVTHPLLGEPVTLIIVNLPVRTTPHKMSYIVFRPGRCRLRTQGSNGETEETERNFERSSEDICKEYVVTEWGASRTVPRVEDLGLPRCRC